MAFKKILHLLFCLSCNLHFDSFGQQNTPGQLTCATDRLRVIYAKYNGTFEQGDNNHPLITGINNWIELPNKSPYCGSTIVWMCKEAGIQLVDIPITKMGLSKNWKRYGTPVWDTYNGWRVGAKREPKCDEIYVLYFNWNGRGHVAVALWWHGGLNFITGEGNTSNAKVRKKKYGVLNDQNLDATYFVPYTTYKGKAQYRQGIFAYKERYTTTGLIAVVSIKVKLLN